MIVPVSLLIGSVSLDLIACYCVKRSKGFKKVVWGLAGLLAIISAIAPGFFCSFLGFGEQWNQKPT